MTDRTCETCCSYLDPGKRARNGQRYFTACCQHPRAVNLHGIIAASLARASGGACGPAAALWSAG